MVSPLKRSRLVKEEGFEKELESKLSKRKFIVENSDHENRVNSSVWLPDLESDSSESEYEDENGTMSCYRRIEDGLELPNLPLNLPQNALSIDSVAFEDLAIGTKRSCIGKLPEKTPVPKRPISKPSQRAIDSPKTPQMFEVDLNSGNEETPSGGRSKKLSRERVLDSSSAKKWDITDPYIELCASGNDRNLEVLPDRDFIFNEINLSLNVRDELLIQTVVDEFESQICPEIQNLKVKAAKYESMKRLLNVPSIDEIQEHINDFTPQHNTKLDLVSLLSRIHSNDNNEHNTIHIFQAMDKAIKDKLPNISPKKKTPEINKMKLHVIPKKKVRVPLEEKPKNVMPLPASSEFKKSKAILETIKEDVLGNEEAEIMKVCDQDARFLSSNKIHYQSLDANYQRSRDLRHVKSLSTEELHTIKAKIKLGSFPDIPVKKLNKLIAQFEKLHVQSGGRDLKKGNSFPGEYLLSIGKINNCQLVACIEFEIKLRKVHAEILSNDKY